MKLLTTSLESWCIEKNQKQILEEYVSGHNELPANQISYGSTKKVFWQCSLGHRWQTAPNNRTSQKSGCPICGNKQILVGFNDLLTTHPKIASEWNYDKNDGLFPTEVVARSNKSVWWKCKKEHEYNQKICVRTIQNTGCPICANLKVLPGYNDLETTHPQLAAEWDFDKNKDKQPKELVAGTRIKAWWRCIQGHSWEASVSSRAYGGHGCPYCANQKASMGYNDLESQYPNLAMEWDTKKNGEVTPQDVVAHSNKSFFWLCSKGHSYKASVSSRLRGRGCPYCAGRLVLIGYNDLLSQNPQLATEWHPKLNFPLTPENVTLGSNKKVWWQCRRGHEWQATISSRQRRNGCPLCHQSRQTSLSEKAVLFYVRQIFPSVETNVVFPWSQKFEADIYIPELNAAIEFDGFKWHQDVDKDVRKDYLFAENNVRIIRIREEGCPVYQSDYAIHISSKPNHSNLRILEPTVAELFCVLVNEFGVPPEDLPNINMDKDYSSILALYITNESDTPFTVARPDLLKEWNNGKNNGIEPDALSFGSQKKVWWICEKGHEWQAVVASRVKGSNCPYCAGRYVLARFNDFETFHPDIAKEWDYEKNEGLLPSEVLHSSNKKVWWKCSKGHSWYTAINVRLNNCACPYCSNQKVLQGYNDLATTHPDLLKEWDYEKNGTLTPETVCAGSEKKAWWVCSRGHNYHTMIASRTRLRTGCPMCYKERRKQ